jgi:hypothetical protein
MSDTALLDVTELHKHFHNRNQPVVRAVDGVSFAGRTRRDAWPLGESDRESPRSRTPSWG